MASETISLGVTAIKPVKELPSVMSVSNIASALLFAQLEGVL